MRRKLFRRGSSSTASDEERSVDPSMDQAPKIDATIDTVIDAAETDSADMGELPELDLAGTDLSGPGEVEAELGTEASGPGEEAGQVGRDTARAERDSAIAERDAALAERDTATTDRDIAVAELNAAIVEGNHLRSKLAATSGLTQPRANRDADDLIRAATLEANAIRAEAQCAAERIIELAQDRAATVHRNAESEFRERIRQIAHGDIVSDDIVSDDIVSGDSVGSDTQTADNDGADSEDEPELTHVMKATSDRPPPPPAPIPRRAKSFESLWEAASSVDDADLERFFSEELERTERRALFES